MSGLVLCVVITLAMVGGDRYYGDYGDDLVVRRRVVTRVRTQEPRVTVYRRRKTRPVTVLTGIGRRRSSVAIARGHRVVVVDGAANSGVVPVQVQPVVGVPPPVAHPSIGVSSLPLGGTYQPVGGSYQSVGGSYQPVGGSYQPLGGSHQPVGGSYQPVGGSQYPRLDPGSAGAIDRLPLPKCSYINTDFPGDDLLFDDDEKAGINAGSARACKARCNQEDTCSFWSYREGDNRDTFTRDCFLKEGTPGLPVPRAAVPRLGFVSGTRDSNCICIKSEDEEDEVCPIKNPRGLVYPWQDAGDRDEDPILGWNRGVVGGLDPRLTPYLGVESSLESSVRNLRRQIDILTRALNN